ncbi:hypothetical protein M378DRAFT_954562 [Amanita muscaria Koide BX008]|uniref:BTB domain-containing protein n=1 Tax=Amanita muscaria (strain Koide BX008) TaxID=946122 RepID=A0A0C2WFA9_AMAMK|nr:hypothetical protein M378DRAFT_954562 [Amanita muscaria Koide BX008]
MMFIPFSGFNNTVRRHTRYYYESGNLIIRVTDTLFRVLDEPFRSDSSVFGKRYGLPHSPPGFGECTGTHDNPIVIDDVKPWEFDRFLGVIFPPFHFGSTSFFGDYGLNEWLSVLKLSTMWDFPSVRQLALDHISSMELGNIELAVIGDKYPLPPYWWFSSLVHFVERDEPLSIDEAQQLGSALTVCIFTAREILEEEGRKREEDVGFVVREVFDITLDD